MLTPHRHPHHPAHSNTRLPLARSVEPQYSHSAYLQLHVNILLRLQAVAVIDSRVTHRRTQKLKLCVLAPYPLIKQRATIACSASLLMEMLWTQFEWKRL